MEGETQGDRGESIEVLNFENGILRASNGEQASWPRLALLGDPVEHSLSPALHGAALQGANLPGQYRCVRVAGEEFEACLRSALKAEAVGLNVTLPHKERALRACHQSSSLAGRVGAANTLVPVPNGWEAHNTDVGGLKDALRLAFPGRPWRGECVVVGAGGAARAAVVALFELSAQRVRVFARRVERAGWAASFGASAEDLRTAALDSATLLIQATPLGLLPEDPSPLDPGRIPDGCALMDLCYGATPSALLRAHRTRGPVADGREMLCAQAARSFRLWFPAAQPEEFIRRACPKSPL